MISVGVRDLKNQLSQYLQYVKQGERVLITEHHRVIAEISLPQSADSDQNLDSALGALVASGKMVKAQRNHSLAASTGAEQTVDWISIYHDNRARQRV